MADQINTFQEEAPESTEHQQSQWSQHKSIRVNSESNREPEPNMVRADPTMDFIGNEWRASRVYRGANRESQ